MKENEFNILCVILKLPKYKSKIKPIVRQVGTEKNPVSEGIRT